MIIYRFDSALYIRTHWFAGSLDKVIRVRIDPSGPVDFVGERLISSFTAPSGTIAAYFNSNNILRNGSDESPPAHIDGQWHGGNHPASVHYDLTLKLDGMEQNKFRGVWGVDELELSENYSIPTDSAISLGNSNPSRAVVTIDRRFTGDGFCRFNYSLTAMRQLTLEYVNGMQALKPFVANGRTLHLIVPGSNLSGGIDITSEAQDRLLLPSDWDDPNTPPSYFIQEVRSGGSPQFAFVMGFDAGVNRGTLTSAFERSAAGKLYPRGYEGNETLQPGARRAVSGFFGSYNRLGS